MGTRLSKQQDGKKIFEKLYDLYKERVFYTAYRIIGNTEEARDVSHDIFLKVFTNLHKFRHAASHSTWIYRITVNMSINKIVSNQKHRTIERGMAVETQLSSAPSADITPLLTKLSPPLRAALILRYNEELSYDEISTILNIPIGTVKSRLNEAHRQLREELKNELQ